MRYAQIFAFLFLLSGTTLQAQFVSPNFRQFTTKDGLPSSETYHVCQDRDGFMWFGTDNGVARFDGYEFTVFDTDDGLTDVVVFRLIEGPDGKIWASTFSGKLFYFENGRFHPWGFNHQLLELKTTAAVIVLRGIDKANTFYFTTYGKAQYTIDRFGKVARLDNYERRKIFLNFPEADKETNSKASVRERMDDIGISFRSGFYKDSISLFIKNEQGQELDRTLDFGYGQLPKDQIIHVEQPKENPQRELLFFSRKWVYKLREGQRPYGIEIERPNINYTFSDRKNGYWICANRGKGLTHLEFDDETRKVKINQVFSSASFSYGMYDRNGGLWITSLDAGVYYSSHPEVFLFNENDGLPDSKALCVAPKSKTAFFSGYRNASIYELDVGKKVKARQLLGKLKIAVNVFWLHYLPQNGTLYTPEGYYSPDDQNASEYKLNRYDFDLFYNSSPVSLSFKSGRYDPVYNPDLIMLSGHRIVGHLNVKTNRIDKVDYHTPSYNNHSTIIDHEGRYLFGTMYGAFEYIDERKLEPIDIDFDALHEERITQMLLLPHQAMVFGTRGKGIIFHSPDTTYSIGETDGLASNMIRDLHRTPDGAVWVATLTGLSKLTFNRDRTYTNLRTFGYPHGLPDLEIHDVNNFEDQIWLATTNGVVRFTEPPVDSITIKPYFQNFNLNGQEVMIDSLNRLPAGKQDIEVTFGALNYRMNGDIPFRYRLKETDDWQYTSQRTVKYPNLNPGNYRFEVQSQNQDKYWSESAIKIFTIPDIWYNRWPAWMIFGLLGVLAFAAVFLWRDRQLKRRQAILLQINDLERSAVQAQMNPHFVFNSLNSIQYFILNNDTKQAVTYLARFAQLIRKTLRSSATKEHSLEEEIQLLENYLSLEKLRFKDNFCYNITPPATLEVQKIKIAPMLIQPFVENAVIHGLKDVDEGGRVDITFREVDGELEIDIEDNGVGFDPNTDTKASSLGMSITRRRLNMMKRVPGSTPRMQIQQRIDPDGNAAGTRVKIRVAI